MPKADQGRKRVENFYAADIPILAAKMAKNEAISLKSGRICYQADKFVETIELLRKSSPLQLPYQRPRKLRVARPDLKEILQNNGFMVSFHNLIKPIPESSSSYRPLTR